MNVFISFNNLDEYILISLFLMNSSILAIISGLVFEDVVNPATEFDLYSACMGSM